MNNCVCTDLVLIPLKKVNTNHVVKIPFTSSIALTADLPSALKATHTYFPLSFFSALMICKDPFGSVKSRSPSLVSGVSYLTLGAQFK